MQECSSLEQLFPDIGEELENRHSSHFGDLKRRFSKTYADYEPQWFVSAKAVVRVAEVTGTNFAVSMAMENGTVLAAAVTHPQQHIYINTEEQHAEIVLNCQGELLEGHSPLAQLLSQAYRKGIENAVLSKLSGAIIYFDVTIERESRGYRESIAMAIARAAITINDLQEEETADDLEERLLVVPLERLGYNLYQNMTMLFHCGNGSCEGLQLAAEGYTFLLCAIDDPPIERSLLQATKQLMQLELEVLETIASLLVVGYYEQSHNQNECSCLTALMNIGQLDKLHSALQPGQHSLEQYEIMLGIQLPTDKLPDKTIQLKLHQRLTTFITQYRSIRKLAREPPKKQTIRQSLAESLEILREHNLITTQAQQLLQICEQSGALASTVAQGYYVLALYEKNKMLHAFELLRNCLYGQVTGDEPHHATPHRIKKMLFSSLPSRGCGVLDPSQEIWFM